MRDVTHGPDSSNEDLSQDRASFAAELMQLKRQGCSVLVTGRVNERLHAAQSCQLFGARDASRHRVLTLTDATPARVCQYLPDGVAPADSSVTVLDYTETVRNVTGAADTPLHQLDTDDSKTVGNRLGAMLCEPVEAAVRNGPTGPSVCRLGVATLGALIAIDGLSPTRSFVRTVRADVVDIHGIVHFHLPGTPDSKTLDTLYPVTDIHIELRESRCLPEHRWHLLDSDLSTDWLPVRS